LEEQRRWDGEGIWDIRGRHRGGAEGSKEGREGDIVFFGRGGQRGGVLDMGMMELENGEMHTTVDAGLFGDQRLAVVAVLALGDDALAEQLGPGFF
jgi:hypothetical protein